MTTTVEEFISGKPPVISVRLGDSLVDAGKLMLRHDYSQLPVVDSEAKPIGLITSDSILNALHNYGVGLEGIGDSRTTPQKRSIQNLRHQLTPEGQRKLKFAGYKSQL